MTNQYDEADVVIIGGGMTGAAIARELSRYKIETILLEKGGNLSAGQSKEGLNHIYTGLVMVSSFLLKSVMLPPGTPPTREALYHRNLKVKWSEEGFDEWPQVFKELDIKYKYLPTLIIAQDKKEIKDLERMAEIGRGIGGRYADFKQVDREEILTLEPAATPKAIIGLYAKNHVIDAFPPEIVIGLAENAKQNDAKIMLNTEVTGISRKNGYQIVETTGGFIRTNFIINAAGREGGKIADMGGARDWNLKYARSQLIILDKRTRGLVKGFVRVPTRPGRAEMVERRDDNVLIMSGYEKTNDKDATYIIRKDAVRGIAEAKRLVPGISEKDVINTFAGVRSFNTRDPDDHIVEFASNNPKFLNVMIRPPGTIGAIPMARYVVEMLGNLGIALTRKSDFNPYRKGIPRFTDLSDIERKRLIAKDSRYGHVVCRCEHVTEGEIVKAIRQGAITEEGVRMRTRAGMGRCKGGFCSPRIIKILARELNVSPTKVTKRYANDFLIPYRNKEFLLKKCKEE